MQFVNLNDLDKKILFFEAYSSFFGPKITVARLKLSVPKGVQETIYQLRTRKEDLFYTIDHNDEKNGILVKRLNHNTPHYLMYFLGKEKPTLEFISFELDEFWKKRSIDIFLSGSPVEILNLNKGISSQQIYSLENICEIVSIYSPKILNQ